jgi:hypothetical protein
MKQTLLLLLALICINAKAATAEPAITMTTALNVGQTISFSLVANVANTVVQIDFGDGTLVDKTIATSSTSISGTLVGSQTVKIYGTGINYLYCGSQKLTAIDVSNNAALQNLNCSYNQLTFATLPITKPTICNYSPQSTITIATSFAINTPIDLSRQLTINGNTTTYTWKTESGTTLTDGIDYTIDGGITTFITIPAEKVYCEMTNAMFPELSLKTTSTNISIAKLVITMKTSMSKGNLISFKLRAKVNTVVQIDYGDGWLEKETISSFYSGDIIHGVIQESKTVKIYGAGIDYLDCFNLNLTAIDVTQNTDLEYLDCCNNQLTTLDVTKNTALTKLCCVNNQLTTLDVTKNTALTELSCFNNQLTTLDVTKNMALQTLTCYSNQLTALDLTMNTALTRLWCSNNQLTTLDVTKNTALTELSCYNNQLLGLDVTNNTALTDLRCYNNKFSSLDVTYNTALIYLYCFKNQLTSLDVTFNTALKHLGCYSNQLTALDVTKNTALIDLFCYNNQLSALDVTNNTSLIYLSCYSNQLSFATLPLSKPTNFIYAPQNAVTIAPSFAPNTPIDLSSQLTANGNATTYTWKTESGTTLTPGTDYTIDGGITTFTTIPAEKVYCEMTNATFPAFTGTNVLKTTLTTIGTTTAAKDAKAGTVDIYTRHQTVYLSLPQAAMVQVYDITGHLVKAHSCNSGTNSFELPQKGIFVVKVNMEKQTETRKIVVR